MAKELALQQITRHGRAVHLDERLGAAPREVVNGAGHQVLAGSRFPGDEHRDVDAGGVPDDFAHVAHPGAAPELHLASDAGERMLGWRLWSTGRRRGFFDGRRELVVTEGRAEHGVDDEGNGVDGAVVVAVVDHPDDGAGITALKLQAMHEVEAIRPVGFEVQEREEKVAWASGSRASWTELTRTH